MRPAELASPRRHDIARTVGERSWLNVLGMVKPNAAVFSDREYERHVRDLGTDYLSRLPRPIAE